MENASKALLIAAAVLIVILLIAFGMQILNPMSDTIDSADQAGTAITESSAGAKNTLVDTLDSIGLN